MAWIESHQALGQHPKAYRLAKTLGCNLPTAVGHLQYLWWWSLDYAQDGSLARYGNEVIARACLWDGEPEILVVGLITAGFLERDENGDLHIHDWGDYAGRLIERRRADAQRKRGERASKGRPADAHDPSVGRPADVQRTQPNPTGPDPTEKKTGEGSGGNPPPGEGSAAGPALVAEEAAPAGGAGADEQPATPSPSASGSPDPEAPPAAVLPAASQGDLANAVGTGTTPGSAPPRGPSVKPHPLRSPGAGPTGPPRDVNRTWEISPEEVAAAEEQWRHDHPQGRRRARGAG